MHLNYLKRMKKNYKRNWLFKLKTAFVFGSMLLAGSAMAQLSGTYTVNSGSATSGTNFKSFTDLQNSLNSNGIRGAVNVNVVKGSGPYNEDFRPNQISGASATSRITINGNGEKLRNGGTVVYLNGTDYITFDNIYMEQSSSSDAPIFWGAGNGCTGVTIQNCDIIATTSNSAPGYPGYYNSAYIYFNNQQYYYRNSSVFMRNLIIKNNNLSKSNSNVNAYGKYLGIFISNPDRNGYDQEIEITGNDIQDIGIRGIWFYEASGVDVTFNRVHNPNCNNTRYIYAIVCDNYYMTGKEVNFSDNIIENLGTSKTYQYADEIGIYLYAYRSGSTYNVKNNIVNLSGPSYNRGIYNYAYYNSGKINIINNSVLFTGTNTRYHYGIYNYASSGGVCNNNIVSQQATVNGNHRTYLIYDVRGTGTTYDYNNLDLTQKKGTATQLYTGYWSGNKASLKDWQGSATAANSIAVNPQFTDITTTAKLNYKPQSIPMVNKGVSNTFTPPLDCELTKRGSTPDLGALEYYIDVEVTSVNMTGGTGECAPYKESVSVIFKNNSLTPIQDVPWQYTVNGGAPYSETDTSSVAPGAVDTFTFERVHSFNGSNTHAVVVSVVGDDDVPTNSTGSYKLSTVASASGSNLIASASLPFDGYYNAATTNDPDVIAKDYTNNYDITRPTKYASSGPGADYTYSFKATDDDGIDVSAAGFSYTALAESFIVSPEDSLAGRSVQLDLMVTDAATGCDTTVTRHMYIPHVPEPSFDSYDICLGDVAQFKNTSTLKGSGYIVTSWDFDDPDPAITDDNSDIKDGFWKYSTYGNDVYVKMTVANGVYDKFTYVDVDTINITPKPEVDFKVLNACEGTAIKVNNNTTLPVSSKITYVWDFGGEYTSTDQDPSYTFATPGQRKISVTATANGCTGSLTKNAYQFEMPLASFDSKGECNFVNVDFTNSSTIENGANMGYAWDFNGEGISRILDPSFAFATPGTKKVTLTATSEFGCVNVFNKSIILQESPEADFTWDAACNLTPINFNITGSLPNGGANSSYEWDFAGESSAKQADPSYLFSKVGPKVVKLTISDLNGCSSSIEKEVNVVLQATADFESGTVCEGDEAVFTNKSTVAAGNLTYEWTFGDGAGSSDLSPRHSYTDAKSYNVKLKAIVEGGCSDEVTYPVVVNPSPDATFTLSKDGRTIVCNGPSGNDIYRWTFGDGSKDDSENPTYTFENVDQGTFTVCLATKKGECWNDLCEDITINLAGIENLTQNDDMINIYPNPTTGKFNVTVENADDVVVKVGDILGNVLDVNVIDNMNGTYSVDMSVVADGVYFVQVINGDYFSTKRITVSK